MPAAAAIPWLGTAIAGAAGAGATIVGAKMQSGAANDAAGLQTNAANHAADLQDQAAQRAEAFQRQQAEQQWREGQQTQRANYDQWRARQGTIAGFGAQYGLGGIDIPEYVAGEDPHYDQGSTAPPGSVAGASGGADPQIASFIAKWQADPSHPASEGIGPLSDAIAKQFPGVSRFMYGQTPSNNELNIGGQKYKVLGAENSPNAYWYKPGTNDGAPVRPSGSIAAMTPYTVPSLVAPTTGIPTPYQPGTIASYGRMR